MRCFFIHTLVGFCLSCSTSSESRQKKEVSFSKLVIILREEVPKAKLVKWGRDKVIVQARSMVDVAEKLKYRLPHVKFSELYVDAHGGMVVKRKRKHSQNVICEGMCLNDIEGLEVSTSALEKYALGDLQTGFQLWEIQAFEQVFKRVERRGTVVIGSCSAGATSEMRCAFRNWVTSQGLVDIHFYMNGEPTRAPFREKVIYQFSEKGDHKLRDIEFTPKDDLFRLSLNENDVLWYRIFANRTYKMNSNSIGVQLSFVDGSKLIVI